MYLNKPMNNSKRSRSRVLVLPSQLIAVFPIIPDNLCSEHGRHLIQVINHILPTFRSPPSINCSYSPVSSPESHVYSPTMSPLRYSPLLYSPSDDRSQPSPEPTYSPVENFSDEEDEETPSTVKESRSKEDKSSMKQGGNSSNVTAFCDQSTTSDKDNSSQQQNAKSEKSATAESKPETPELIPWTKRTIRIQRTATYLGQTFVLPPVSDERPGFGEGQGPSKRPRLSGRLK